MDIKQLQYVLALARNKNFTRTANELYITQPYLSSNISMIEEELGVKLFERSTRSVSLTDAGTAFCEKAEQVLKDWDAMLSSMDQYRKEPSSSLVIGVSFRGQCSAIMDSCMTFFSEHSECKVSYINKEDDEILDALRDGSMDAGICRISSSKTKRPVKAPLNAIPLIKELTYFIMSEAHPLADRPVLSLRDLQDQTLIVGLEGSAADQGLKGQARKLKIPHLNVIHANSSSMIISLLKEGRGIIMGPRSIADFYGLKAVESDKEEYGQLGLVYNAETDKPILNNLINYLSKNSNY